MVAPRSTTSKPRIGLAAKPPTSRKSVVRPSSSDFAARRWLVARRPSSVCRSVVVGPSLSVIVCLSPDLAPDLGLRRVSDKADPQSVRHIDDRAGG